MAWKFMLYLSPSPGLGLHSFNLFGKGVKFISSTNWSKSGFSGKEFIQLLILLVVDLDCEGSTCENMAAFSFSSFFFCFISLARLSAMDSKVCALGPNSVSFWDNFTKVEPKPRAVWLWGVTRDFMGGDSLSSFGKWAGLAVLL